MNNVTPGSLIKKMLKKVQILIHTNSMLIKLKYHAYLENISSILYLKLNEYCDSR